MAAVRKISTGLRARAKRGACAGWALVLAPACGDTIPDPTSGAPVVEPGEELLGGETTVFDSTRDAFARPARNLSHEERADFSLGDHLFNRNWVTAPASAEGNDGLGPVYNAMSCSSCHFKDGRGAPPATPDEDWLGLVMRLSAPGEDAHGGPLPEPSYGFQFNHASILGVPSEGRVSVRYEEERGTYGDGEAFSLRRPVYSFPELSFGPLTPGARTAPRIARAIIGLGLLAAIPEETILAHADEDDADRDGISGRPNYVWDLRQKTMVLGRFGWKANRPTVEEQVAGAFHEDIGITTELLPHENCMSPQTACRDSLSGGAPELDAEKLAWTTLYAETLAVPARRGWSDPEVLRGRELFRQAGCVGCHVPIVQTGDHPKIPALSRQTIRPYTDLLLHDMGDGLATDRPEYAASGREWRTPPLWGIGLQKVVNRHEFLLHDGRARGFAEAILWHDGEAIVPKERFRNMPREDRAALIAFLESL